MNPWHAMPAVEVVAALRGDAQTGLTAEDAARRLDRVGPNALPEPTRRSQLAVFARQFKSPLIYLLFAAAGIAAALGYRTDAIVIAGVVLLNAIIGALQEGRAERSLEALRKLTTHRSRVVRDGRELVIEARGVVPGDLLLLDAGDAVTADARLLDAAALTVAEAALTGESVPVSKDVGPADPDAALADRSDMVYAGTHVTAGRARAVVVGTGPETELGHIASLTLTTAESRTPLERRLDQFGRYVIVAAIAMFVLINAVGLVRGMAFGDIVMIGISQVVGMIPEGLPVAMTIALAVGVQRMARRRAVVRRLAAVETLGSTSVICSDKTGTLTRNEMTVTRLVLPGGRELSVTGTGYEPSGTLVERGEPVAGDRVPRELLEACVLCNDAELQGPEATEPRWKPIGDPTEVALVVVARKAGLDPREVRARTPRQAELPFDPTARMMATQHATPGGSRVIVKGAPEVVVELCASARVDGRDVVLDEDGRASILAAAQRMAAGALRVLAIAAVEGAELGPTGFDALRRRATLLGLAGEIDPPRPEVADAVARCRAAGIRPVMVTGDHRATATAVARSLGIAREGDATLDGRELERLSDAELAARIEEVAVFARVQPAQKLRIVAAYQQRGEVVAMTGDGVNDAPALVKADVGVAMGVTGTEVAKEASKIVVTDDNFATIVAAVEEGRVVYRNIKKALLLLFSTSAAEVLVLVLAMLLGYPAPFAAVQILWNNLVTEGLITINLVLEPPEGDEMQRPPISRAEPLLSRTMLVRMAVMTPAIVISTLGWYAWRTSIGIPAAQVQTETFTLLAICEWFNVLNCRSETRSALALSVLRNRWLVGGLVAGNLLQIAAVFWAPLGRVMHTVPFGLDVVLALALVGSLVLWVEEARKLVVRRRARRGQR